MGLSQSIRRRGDSSLRYAKAMPPYLWRTMEHVLDRLPHGTRLRDATQRGNGCRVHVCRDYHGRGDDMIIFMKSLRG
jgi:hypothetical protein